jgi:hypothetical protein
LAGEPATTASQQIVAHRCPAFCPFSTHIVNIPHIRALGSRDVARGISELVFALLSEPLLRTRLDEAELRWRQGEICLDPFGWFAVQIEPNQHVAIPRRQIR